MRVLINGTSARVGGGLSYLGRQLGGLAAARPDWSLVVVATPANAAALRSSVARDVAVIALPVKRVWDRWLAEQAFFASGRGADLTYHPGNFLPLTTVATNVPSVLTIQNPNYWGVGRNLPANKGLGRRGKIALAELSVRLADGVVAISRSLREQVESSMGVQPHMTIITSGTVRLPTTGKVPSGLAETGYLLSLANEYPHKRLRDCVRAWVFAVKRYGTPLDLVMVGDLSPGLTAELRTMAAAVSSTSRLHLLGSVADPSVVGTCISSAVALVSTSQLEAYPLTPEEAGNLGTPCILTDIPAHREVAPEGTRFFPVGNIDACARLIADLDPKCGFAAHSKRRTWADHGEELATFMERIVS